MAIMSLVFFGGNSGWAKKLLPLNEKRFVSRAARDQYGQELQIVHPEVVVPEEADSGGREAVYPCSEGITSKRIAAMAAQAIERAPELPEWIEPSLKAKPPMAGLARGAGADPCRSGRCQGARAAGL
jgi:ATP-dependent DNA helicase RecG